MAFISLYKHGRTIISVYIFIILNTTSDWSIPKFIDSGSCEISSDSKLPLGRLLRSKCVLGKISKHCHLCMRWLPEIDYDRHSFMRNIEKSIKIAAVNPTMLDSIVISPPWNQYQKFGGNSRF